MSALEGKKIIATCEEEKALKVRNIFASYGAETQIFPLIETHDATDHLKEIQRQFESINNKDWVIFTSTNGVKYFFHWTKKLNLSFNKHQFNYAAIGEATGERLKQEGIKPAYVGTGRSSTEFGSELMSIIGPPPQQLLIPTGNMASDQLKNVLNEKYTCGKMVVYNTSIKESPDPAFLELLGKGDYDLLLFLSPSAVDGFFQFAANTINLKPISAAAIGPTTEKALLNQGLEPVFVPSQPNLELMAAETEDYFRNN
ncbi:MAG: uroporphyrinogen-III synthase [Bacteroidales bacterium]|nr:uroporphyrinogen-III synthase [Bacteroidales bacterium]MCF8336459.1 uroporphyrinogen-III synthase [Bacteroidales bacterium]